jgi:hypothetical protein
MLVILSRHVVFIAPNHIFNYLDFQTLTLNIADEGYSQRPVEGLWFSPGTPASSTIKPGRHDIAEILLKVALKLQKQNIKNHYARVDANPRCIGDRPV